MNVIHRIRQLDHKMAPPPWDDYIPAFVDIGDENEMRFRFAALMRNHLKKFVELYDAAFSLAGIVGDYPGQDWKRLREAIEAFETKREKAE